MTNKVNEEPNIVPKLLGGKAGNKNQRGGLRARNSWNNAAAGNPPRNKFKSTHMEINKDITFDNTGSNTAANFQKLRKGIANYLLTKYCAELLDDAPMMLFVRWRKSRSTFLSTKAKEVWIFNTPLLIVSFTIN